jgi:hypothetical protein
MGGVFGHMSHIYDNPSMTFGQIKDIMTKASAGQLESVTEKTDGQNLFVSYNVQDGTVRAARNKGNLKTGGMDAAALAEKFGGRGALTDAFVNAFKAFEIAVNQFSDEEKLELFGPDTNIFYNAEVMDPANANVINYDTKTFLIHRAGHAEFDRETGKPVSSEQGFSEKKAGALQAALEKAQESMKGDFKVQVNAIRQLKALGDDVALSIALKGMDKVMSSAGVSDNDTIADYVIGKWRILVNKELPELSDQGKQLIIKRVMSDYYGALEGDGPLKSRGLETRQIVKAINQPELNEKVVALIKSYPDRFKEFIFPVESVIHRFAIAIMRAVQSAYIIAAGGNEKEVARLQALVGKAIDTIQGSGNEEAMEILKPQLEKLSQIEDDGSVGDVDLSMISSAAEGIVFDYDGHTYKFTGGFAPANQILGLFKYGRKGIPAMASEEDLAEASVITSKKLKAALARTKPKPAGPGVFSEESEEEITKEVTAFLTEEPKKRTVAIYPGRFQPMGPHHFQTYKQIAAEHGAENTYVATSDKTGPKSPLNFAEKKSIILKHGVPDNQVQQVTNPYYAKEIYEQLGGPEEIEVVYFVGDKDMRENPRFQKTGGTTKEGYDWRLAVAPHVEIDIPGFGEMCGTSLRDCLGAAKPEQFKAIMGWFDPGVYKMLQSSLQETAMASGAVAISPGRAPVVVGSEKEKKKHKKNFLEEEELVSEVMDYLLGITVG